MRRPLGCSWVSPVCRPSVSCVSAGCLLCVCRVSPGVCECLLVSPGVSLWMTSGVSWVSPGCLLGVSWCLPGVSWVSPGYLLDVPWVTPGVSWVPPGCLLVSPGYLQEVTL
jgi:hypothetical protein